jgi:5,10-methylene-tetrahydrofolate dehydrogenase/methenyl tetrahydrofolate cyclohydrolase
MHDFSENYLEIFLKKYFLKSNNTETIAEVQFASFVTDVMRVGWLTHSMLAKNTFKTVQEVKSNNL